MFGICQVNDDPMSIQRDRSPCGNVHKLGSRIVVMHPEGSVANSKKHRGIDKYALEYPQSIWEMQIQIAPPSRPHSHPEQISVRAPGRALNAAAAHRSCRTRNDQVDAQK